MSVIFKNENDYSVIIYFPMDLNKVYPKPLKVQYVHNIYSLIKWLESSKYSNWYRMYVYARRSRQLLRTYNYGDFVEQKPK